MIANPFFLFHSDNSQRARNRKKNNDFHMQNSANRMRIIIFVKAYWFYFSELFCCCPHSKWAILFMLSLVPSFSFLSIFFRSSNLQLKERIDKCCQSLVLIQSFRRYQQCSIMKIAVSESQMNKIKSEEKRMEREELIMCCDFNFARIHKQHNLTEVNGLNFLRFYFFIFLSFHKITANMNANANAYGTNVLMTA